LTKRALHKNQLRKKDTWTIKVEFHGGEKLATLFEKGLAQRKEKTQKRQNLK